MVRSGVHDGAPQAAPPRAVDGPRAVFVERVFETSVGQQQGRDFLVDSAMRRSTSPPRYVLRTGTVA